MAEVIAKFFCNGCKKGYTWKKELAGKRAKCKRCGQTMAIPAEPWQPEPEPQPEDDLYSVAEPPPGSRPKPIKAPPLAVATAPVSGGNAATLAYHSGPTRREKQLASYSTFVHMPRDRYVPIAMLVVGTILFVARYTMATSIGLGGIGFTVGVLTVATLIETGLLVGFALAIADPVGVSFGTFWTAVLKLAAIVVFSDGVTVWLDAWGGQISMGLYGFTISFVAAAIIYWAAMTYLFEMEASESWLVVVLLSICYRLLRLALFLALLAVIAKTKGAGAPALRGTAFYVAPPPLPPPSPIMAIYGEARRRRTLVDAAKWEADHKLTAELNSINQWKATGAKSVEFMLAPVGIGHTGAPLMFIELPSDPMARAKCYDIAKSYYAKTRQTFIPPPLLKDSGDPEMAVVTTVPPQ